MLQMTLDFDHTLVAVDSLQTCGELPDPFNLPCTLDGGECDGLGAGVYCGPDTLTCSQCTVTQPEDLGATLLTGHTIETCAQPPANCADGEFFVLFYGAESLPITAAYLDNGNVTGNSEFISIRFSLNTNVPDGTSVSISPVDFKAPDAQAQGLPLQVVHDTAPNPDHYILTGAP